jgi:hypothetical protein
MVMKERSLNDLLAEILEINGIDASKTVGGQTAMEYLENVVCGALDVLEDD